MRIRNLLRIVRLLLGFIGTWFRSRKDLALENLALRQQLATFKRETPRPRISGFDRVFWVFLRGVWTKWNNALILVSPDTVVRWHRKGFRLYWNALSRKGRKPGRPQIDREIRDLICRMAAENPTWGAPRIHGELLKLGLTVSERTVSRYLPKRKPSDDQLKKWKIFLKLHAKGIAAMDFFVVPSATFRMLYVWFVIEHGRRRIAHFNVTSHPHSQWVIQQLREAFPYEEAPRHLIFDRDSIFSRTVVRTIKSFDTKPARTAYRSPWQNPFAERWVRSVREEMLDHVVILGEEHLWELMRAYVRYHNVDRPHYSLKQKDAPISRQIQQRPSSDAKVIAFPRGCGIHHRYEWREAA